jgi:hypothetical protein
MKKLFSFIIMAFIAFPLLHSCSENDDSSVDIAMLSGRWKLSPALGAAKGGDYIITFNANGTGSVYISNSNGTASVTTRFRYSLGGDKSKKIQGNNCVLLKVEYNNGEKFSFHIQKLNNRYLALQSWITKTESVRTFVRYK